MKSFRVSLLAALLCLVYPAVMHAQGGCVDSPEAPTNALMLIGSFGMMYGSSVVMKLLRKVRKN